VPIRAIFADICLAKRRHAAASFSRHKKDCL
jgi:hypothetical protein